MVVLIGFGSININIVTLLVQLFHSLVMYNELRGYCRTRIVCATIISQFVYLLSHFAITKQKFKETFIPRNSWVIFVNFHIVLFFAIFSR